MKLRAGTRGSQLALWQTHHVGELLRAAAPGLEVEAVIVRTTGDRVTDVPLASIGDRGLFTRELDRAVLEGTADCAVHSLKDIPTRLPDGLVLAAILEREDPRDAFLHAPGRASRLADLPAGALVGTSSLRRRALLLELRPDLRIADLRGNLDTRIERLREGAYDGIVLALAGILRLGCSDAVGEVLSPPAWLPAAGQGAIAVTCRDGDRAVLDLLAPLDHPATRAAVLAERALLQALEGGCQIPLGALARVEGGQLALHGFVGGVQSGRLVRGSRRGPAAESVSVGTGLAGDLCAMGADALLAEARAEPSLDERR